MSMNIIEDQCQNCFRTFNPDALKRHKPICAKVSNKIRKPMDTQKQRLAGTDIPLPKKNERRHPPATRDLKPSAQVRAAASEIAPKKSNWREQHQEFLRNIRYARQAKAAEERGEQVAPPPPSEKPSDYVECPTCGRSFQPNSAERHVKFCAEQAKRKPVNHKTKTDAAARREKMMGFKSTFDKRKQQQQQTTQRHADHLYNPGNYAGGGGGGGGVPQSRTLRMAENKSAPTPSRRMPGEIVRNNTNAGPGITRMNNNINSHTQRVSSARGGGERGSKNPPFCYECGFKYPVKTAKFCCECGSPRLSNDS